MSESATEKRKENGIRRPYRDVGGLSIVSTIKFISVDWKSSRARQECSAIINFLQKNLLGASDRSLPRLVLASGSRWLEPSKSKQNLRTVQRTLRGAESLDLGLGPARLEFEGRLLEADARLYGMKAPLEAAVRFLWRSLINLEPNL